MRKLEKKFDDICIWIYCKMDVWLFMRFQDLYGRKK